MILNRQIDFKFTFTYRSYNRQLGRVPIKIVEILRYLGGLKNLDRLIPVWGMGVVTPGHSKRYTENSGLSLSQGPYSCITSSSESSQVSGVPATLSQPTHIHIHAHPSTKNMRELR